MIVTVTVLTYIIVPGRWKMLCSHTLNPRGVNSIRCTRVQSGDDQAEIAFEKSKEIAGVTHFLTGVSIQKHFHT